MDDSKRAVPENIIAQRVLRRELDGLPQSLKLVLYQYGLITGGLLLLIGFAFLFLNSIGEVHLKTSDSISFLGTMAFIGVVIFAVSLLLVVKAMRRQKSAVKLAKEMPVEDVALVLAEKNEWLWSADIARHLFVVQKETRFAPLYLAVQYPSWKVEPNFSMLRRVEGVERLAELDYEMRKLAIRNAILFGFLYILIFTGIAGWVAATFNISRHPVYELIHIFGQIPVAVSVVFLATRFRQKGDRESEELLSQLSDEELLVLRGGRLGMLARNLVKNRGKRRET